MRDEFELLVKPCFPFQVQVGNFRLRGKNHEFFTYDCHVSDPVVRAILEGFYRRNYKAKEGKYLFPSLDMHVTIDTDERRSEIEDIIRNKANGEFTVTEATFETRNDRADASAVFDAVKWVCLRCEHENPIGSKTCSGQRGACTQWRPKAAMSPPQPREGDWTCCGELQFKTRLACRKCGARKKARRQGSTSPPR